MLYSPTGEYNKIEIFKMAASRFVEVSDKEISEITMNSDQKNTKKLAIILKQLFASGSVIIEEYSPRLRLGEYSPIIASPSAKQFSLRKRSLPSHTVFAIPARVASRELASSRHALQRALHESRKVRIFFVEFESIEGRRLCLFVSLLKTVWLHQMEKL